MPVFLAAVCMCACIVLACRRGADGVTCCCSYPRLSSFQCHAGVVCGPYQAHRFVCGVYSKLCLSLSPSSYLSPLSHNPTSFSLTHSHTLTLNLYLALSHYSTSFTIAHSLVLSHTPTHTHTHTSTLLQPRSLSLSRTTVPRSLSHTYSLPLLRTLRVKKVLEVKRRKEKEEEAIEQAFAAANPSARVVVDASRDVSAGVSSMLSGADDVDLLF